MLCNSDLFLKPPDRLEPEIMPNLNFAQRAYVTEFPLSSGAPAHNDLHRCEPAEGQQQHMFHWLVFAEASPAAREASGVGCDLWRWHRGEWRSVFVAGAAFSPEEMDAQGWRYCAPNVQLFVNFASAPMDCLADAEWPDGLPELTATVPQKRKRTRSSAASASSPVRRGVLRAV
jgi:hypothetical protein